MARSPGRRDDDRYARDRRDDRGYRRRSRSRERRYDDRDRDRELVRRRDRSRDRYDEYRGGRRDRSRDRKRSRETSPVRDRRYERDRYRDDDRDRKRPRREDGSPRHRHREDSRDRRSIRSGSVKGNESPRSTADAVAEEAKKAKLAKVEAWKAKMAEKKRQEASISGAASPQVSVKAEDMTPASPAVGSPNDGSQVTTTRDSPALKDPKSASPAPYAGKFDPKMIAKRAAAALEKQKAALGGDVVLPRSMNEAPNVRGSKLADNNKVATSSSVITRTKAVDGESKISGFGLNKAGAEKTGKPTTAKPAANLDEDVEDERKLEKLPDLPVFPDTGDAALANGVDDQDEGDDIRSDEEEAEAAREAAQKRAQEAQAEAEDIRMTRGEETAALQPEPELSINAEPSATAADVNMEDEDEVDPLDAFMNNLEQPVDIDMPNLAIGKSKNKEPQVFNSDDEGDLDAVGNNTDDILAIAAKRKKKDIPTTDHAKIQYQPFRKNFYSEPVELAEMTKDDVEMLRAEMENTKIRGADPPKPISSFSQGGFGAQILDVIRSMRYERPTAIQSSALPGIMSGRDIIGVAKTGSGKTVAFILPMFRHIKDQRPLENLDGPIGLVLAPTRELATQIHRDCKPYLKALNLRAVCAYGGAPIKDQIAELKRGAEIVVCTPGRLIDLLSANSGRVTNLKRVTYVVLDEADRMFDMGFEPQMTKILNNIRPDRQTVLFSATFPKSMEALARKALTKPLEIVVGGRSVVAPEITQVVEVRPEQNKFNRLLELLGDLHDKDEDARSLIFVERQETADATLRELLKKGYPCVSIHGGREQIDRDQAISDFKAGIYPVMIATSVAARGLDVKQLKLVINYDAPNHIEDYVHRVGRTGRAGNTGTAVTFVTPEQDRFAPFLIKALTDSKQQIPESVQSLQKAYDEKVRAGEAKKASSGFGGKGIERLDAARDAERARERKQYKIGDEPEEEEEQAEKKADPKQSEVDKLVAKAATSVKDRDAKSDEPPVQDAVIPSALNAHLDNAMKVQKAELPAGPTANDPLARVSAAVANINSRLGQKGGSRPGVPVDNRGPDAGAYHATLEINDFPQKARWAVTNRTNVAKILEATGTSITTKGNHYAAGKEPEPGQPPKLYILVEGDTEVVVETAMGELTRLLRDGMLAAMEAENRAAPSGRYSVV